MAIESLKDRLSKTFSKIKQYQNGEIKPINTGRPWLKTITPKSILTIAGASFGGKSTELQNLKRDIMNREINEDADKFVWLSYDLEMTNFSTTIRDLKRLLKKGKEEILSKKFSYEERDIVNNYYKEMSDGRYFLEQSPDTSEGFLLSVRNFLDKNKDKHLVVLSVDHIALIKSIGKTKKSAVDDVVEGLNELKNEYDNFFAIILTQLNRDILGRIEEKSNNFAVRRSDIYQSDTMFHVSDYLYALQNAFYLNVREYRKIYPDKYPHLSDRFTEEDTKGRVSLFSEGCIFVEVLKDRDADMGYTDLFTIEIYKPERETRKAESPSIDPPLFN